MPQLPFHTSPALSTPHGFFTRRGGVSKGLYDSLNCGLGSQDGQADIVENRDRVRRALGAQDLVTAHQTHSARTAFIDTAESGLNVDALVTKTPGLAIGALAADCGPILLHEPRAGIIGAAHSGWRGAANGILQNVVETMCTHGAQRDKIQAVIGPCISQRAYEVGPDFTALFEAEHSADLDLFRAATKPDHRMFDLPGFIERQLTRAGVCVSRAHACTYENEADYFSYRRTTHKNEPDYGRQISAICLPTPGLSTYNRG